jgi:hypothetical protein
MENDGSIFNYYTFVHLKLNKIIWTFRSVFDDFTDNYY